MMAILLNIYFIGVIINLAIITLGIINKRITNKLSYAKLFSVIVFCLQSWALLIKTLIYIINKNKE